MGAVAAVHRTRAGGRRQTAGRAITRFARFLTDTDTNDAAAIDRPVLERYLADLHDRVRRRQPTARRPHRTAQPLLRRDQPAPVGHSRLPAGAMFFTERHSRNATERLPRALADHVMAQVEQPANLDRWDNLAYRLITLILIRCGLRVTDALRLPTDCVVTDADGAPYLRYLNHKMKREALVPIDEQLQSLISRAPARQWRALAAGTARLLFPRPTKNVDGTQPIGSSHLPVGTAIAGWPALRRPRRARPAQSTSPRTNGGTPSAPA